MGHGLLGWRWLPARGSAAGEDELADHVGGGVLEPVEVRRVLRAVVVPGDDPAVALGAQAPGAVGGFADAVGGGRHVEVVERAADTGQLALLLGRDLPRHLGLDRNRFGDRFDVELGLLVHLEAGGDVRMPRVGLDPELRHDVDEIRLDERWLFHDRFFDRERLRFRLHRQCVVERFVR